MTMKRTTFLASATMLAVWATGAVPQAQDPGPVVISAFAINMGTISTARNALVVDLIVNRWSTAEEREQLIVTALEKGPDALLRALQKVPEKGRFRIPGLVGPDPHNLRLGHDIRYAWQVPLPEGGRRIVLMTDRYIGFQEARTQPRTVDYPFTLIEIRVNKDGEGQGKMAVATKITFDKKNKQIELENYGSEPVRLNNVKVKAKSSFAQTGRSGLSHVEFPQSGRRIEYGRRNLPETCRYPSLFQVNTRCWLAALSRDLCRPATLDDIPDEHLDRLAAPGFDWVWLLSVWQTGPTGQRVSRSRHEWRLEFEDTLPDLCEDDIAGSGFAITSYAVHAGMGADGALANLRERLRARGLRLMLDFVPNHTALDHPWVQDRPDYFVAGTEADLQRTPENYVRVERTGGDLVLAHGRDPYFPGWPDTLQLNYSNPALQEAMVAELIKVAGQCDGVRCDMAMLVLPEVFERTWGTAASPFWPTATARVRERVPGFRFMAEVYWDLEWTLQQQGFDYTYDKRLYDRLRERQARPVREHLYAGLDFQDKLARFLENHDEPRAAATFPPDVHRAAAVVTFLTPGLRFFHDGQFQGRMKRVSPHLCRAPMEPVDEELRQFYERLLEMLRDPLVRNGQWQLLECVPAWEGNWTWDAFVAYSWQGPGGQLIVAVNYASHQSQCYVRLPFPDLAGRSWRFEDRLGTAIYDREGDALQAHGLYLDMAPWGPVVFSLTVRGLDAGSAFGPTAPARSG